jgi:N-acetylneuraminic acid mutarotase
MKTFIVLPVFVLFFFSIAAQPDTWQQKTSMSTFRAGAIAFSIDSFAYIGTGDFRKDLWKYNPSSNSWTQRASTIGVGRIAAVGFSIGNYGYVSLGEAYSGSFFSDLQQYDPSSNTWSAKANFPGTTRAFAVSFVINNKGYVALGTIDDPPTQYLNDVWEYDPSLNSWSQKANVPFVARGYASCFVINGKAYVGGGTPDDVFTLLNDWWVYDAALDSWTQIDSFPGPPRGAAVGFSLGNYGYVSTGLDNFTEYNDLWRYDPVSNSWQQKASCPGVIRDGAVSFVLNNKGYLATGEDDNANPLSDLWEYTPDGPTIIAETHPNIGTSIFPNPTKGIFSLQMLNYDDSEKSIQVLDMMGNIVWQEQSNFKLETSIDISKNPKGIYFVKIAQGDKVITQRIALM